MILSCIFGCFLEILYLGSIAKSTRRRKNAGPFHLYCLCSEEGWEIIWDILNHTSKIVCTFSLLQYPWNIGLALGNVNFWTNACFPQLGAPDLLPPHHWSMTISSFNYSFLCASQLGFKDVNKQVDLHFLSIIFCNYKLKHFTNFLFRWLNSCYIFIA